MSSPWLTLRGDSDGRCTFDQSHSRHVGCGECQERHALSPTLEPRRTPDGLAYRHDFPKTGPEELQSIVGEGFGDQAPQQGHSQHAVYDDVVEARLAGRLRVEVQRIEVPGSFRVASQVLARERR